jgi:hypothetical protein
VSDERSPLKEAIDYRARRKDERSATAIIYKPLKSGPGKIRGQIFTLRKADQLLLFAWAEGLAADDMITILRRI